MSFAGINYLAVALAAVAGFAFGSAWYGVLGRRWAAALGVSPEEIRAKGLPFGALMAITFVAELVMAAILAGVIGHLGAGQVTLTNGVISAFFLWLGFVATILVVNYGFQSQKPALTVIDGGHWLGVMAIQGAVIGWMGVG